MHICVDGGGQSVRLMFLPVPALRLMFFRFLHPATPSANQSNLIKSIINTVLTQKGVNNITSNCAFMYGRYIMCIVKVLIL